VGALDGGPWSELTRRYGSPTTCWRRLLDWAADGTVLELGCAFVVELHDAQELRWDECFADGSFAPARQGGVGKTKRGKGTTGLVSKIA